MNISVIGGGPGGAFAAFLLKKARPEWDVMVYERSPPAVTYGWGIVLPEKLYTTLRSVDEPTCERIEERNRHWDPIDTIHCGERVRCGGHPYTSILRSDLLEILQGRCQELGVDMRFETEIEDVDAVAADADLVLGADGIHSSTRDRYADEFGTELTDGENLFSWFGTEQQFAALTHIYVEDEHGLWHGAAYPGPMSTFVVTCEPDTWRRAGIDGMSEDEYIGYLEDVFADHLGNHGLVSNNDRWRPFTTVSNETWHHENVALLGDSAHTAHFTIGSGTRMAIEDAIGLARALDEHGNDVETALEQYEADRKPHVDLLQKAADRSQRHFEHLERYARLDPIPFAALYLTRTGHNSYESLREEDPSFVADIDRWFASTARDGSSPDGDPGPPLEQPFTLGSITVPNRLVAVRELDSGPDGRLSDGAEHRLLEGDRAGLVTVPVVVSADDHERPSLHADADVDRWEAALDRFGRERDAIVAARLVHDGVVTDGDGSHVDESGGRVGRAFREAAERAANAGFDALELDIDGGADAPTDNLEDLPISVVEAARDAWPDDRPLLATLPAVDGDERGREDSYATARAFADRGCDALSIVPSGDEPDPPSLGAEHSKRVRNEVGVPTVAGGPQPSADAVNTALASGRADLCTIDPDAFDEGE